MKLWVVFDREAEPCIQGIYETEGRAQIARVRIAKDWAEHVMRTADPMDVFGEEEWDEKRIEWMVWDALRTLEIEEVGEG